MYEIYLVIFKEFGINDIQQLDNTLIERDILLNDVMYQKIKVHIVELKKHLSSSFLTCLQENAETKQKFPLINIVRQLLRIKNYRMEPIRKANGYEKQGKKLYKRYFLIKKIDI